jgi:hypothetical protein
VNVREWDEEGLRPSFGHEGDWLLEVLIGISATEAAAYCVDTPEGRRLLVATDLALVDATAGDEATTATERIRFIPWPEVTGAELEAEVSIDESARHVVAYTIRVAHPEIEILEPAGERRGDHRALIAFGRELLLRAGQPSTVPPKAPDE